jgi:hypothetical protein
MLSEHVGPMRAIGLAGVLGLLAAGAAAVAPVVSRNRPVIPINSPPARSAIVYRRDTEVVDH